MGSHRRGLGRGLGALIPTAAPAAGRESPMSAFLLRGADLPDELAEETPSQLSTTASASEPSSSEPSSSEPVPPTSSVDPQIGYFAELPIDAVVANEHQPRQVFDEDALDELVRSIQQVGLLQPVVVRPLGDGRFELVMGERRWRASRLAGLSAIPAIVRHTAETDMLRDALLENLHRVDLNPLEEAAAYGQLLDDFGCTHDELAQRLGRSRPQISNTIRLLRLPPVVQRRVAAGVLSAGHARALLAVDDPERAERLALRVVAEGLSVRALEEIVLVDEETGRPAPTRRTAAVAVPGLTDLSARLSERFDTRVRVDMGRHKGKVTIEFGSTDDLERIVAMLEPGAVQAQDRRADVSA